MLTGLLHLGNPFATTTIDRSPPALLQKISNLSRYHAAEGRFQQTIDLEDKVSFLPSFLAGERTVFIAQGKVDATADFSQLSGDAIQVRGDHAVTVTLPEPKLVKAVVNPATSHVAARESGLVVRAELNTRVMLTGLLGKVGFTDVQVDFVKPTPAPSVQR